MLLQVQSDCLGHGLLLAAQTEISYSHYSWFILRR